MGDEASAAGQTRSGEVRAGGRQRGRRGGGGRSGGACVAPPWPVQQKEALLGVCWHKVAEHLEQGHQVLVFVHTRKDTRATAQDILARAQAESKLTILSPRANPARLDAYKRCKRSLDEAREPSIAGLACNGLGIHHAGMLRGDRLAVEKAFSSGALMVLVCTSTLAWGVNLPARAVIIKGASYYDPSLGATVPLGPLELLQMFGRAGRPQFDKEGDAYVLCAPGQQESLLRQLSSQVIINMLCIHTAHMHDYIRKHIPTDGYKTVARTLSIPPA